MTARERAHRGFHPALIADCGLPLLREKCRMLPDLDDRYRRLADRVAALPRRHIGHSGHHLPAQPADMAAPPPS